VKNRRDAGGPREMRGNLFVARRRWARARPIARRRWAARGGAV